MGTNARQYLINVKYQADEEILQSEIWYWNPVGDDLAVEDLANISARIVTEIGDNLEDVCPVGTIFHSVTVSTPEIENEGPARYINAYGGVMPGDETTLFMDSVCVNVFLRGVHSNGKPVVGVMRWSIVPREKANRNQLDQTWADAVLAAMDLVFPDPLVVGGLNLRRCVKSAKKEEGVPLPIEYVFPTTMSVSPRAGINLTRVGNRPQSNAGPIEEEE